MEASGIVAGARRVGPSLWRDTTMRHERSGWQALAAIGSAILDFGLVAAVLAASTGLVG